MFNLVNYMQLKRDKSACGIVESIALWSKMMFIPTYKSKQQKLFNTFS